MPASPAKLKIFVADDHPVLRAGLRQLIEAQPDMEIAGEASDGATVLEQVRELQPDLTLLDISMPNVSGAVVAEQLRNECADVKVLVLSAHEERGYVKQLLAAGAAGYIVKRSAADELIRAIRAVVAGHIYVDPTVAKALVDGIAQRRSTKAPGIVELSDREAQVLQLLARGHPIKEIAATLVVGARTVETYRTRAMEKVGLKNRADIVRFAVDQGWLSD